MRGLEDGCGDGKGKTGTLCANLDPRLSVSRVVGLGVY